MDNSETNLTVLDQIVQSVGNEVFQKWKEALPEDQQTDEMIHNLSKNAYDITVYVVQSFMDKFNAAAEQLKSEPN